jgi:hypothetical protein
VSLKGEKTLFNSCGTFGIKMATVSAHRYVLFPGTADGVPFEEFVTNFRLAMRGTNMTEDQMKSAFFSHFDQKALKHLTQHQELLDKPLEDAIKDLTKHYVNEKPFNLTKLGAMPQLQGESVRDYLQRLFAAATPSNSKKDPPADMTPDQKLIWDAKRDAQQQQLQDMVKPFFMNGLRPELQQQLGIVYGLGLKEMVKELGKFEIFQREFPINKRPAFGIAMVECENLEKEEKPKREELDKEELAKELEKWWINKNRSNENAAKEWIKQVENNTIPKRAIRPFRKKQQSDRSVSRTNVNQVSATGVTNPAPTVAYSPETMQRAAEMLTALNPPQPTVGLLPAPPAYNMMPYPGNQQFPPNPGNWGQSTPWGFHNQQAGNYGNQNSGNFNNPRPRFNPNYEGRNQRSNNGQQGWRNPEELQYCAYCKKNVGHIEQFCRKRMRDEFLGDRRQQDRAEGQQFANKSSYPAGNKYRPNGEQQRQIGAPEARRAIKPPPTPDNPNQKREPETGSQNYTARPGPNENQSKNGERRPPLRR